MTTSPSDKYVHKYSKRALLARRDRFASLAVLLEDTIMCEKRGEDPVVLKVEKITIVGDEITVEGTPI